MARLACTILGAALLLSGQSTTAQTSSATPLGTIAVGDSPFALALSADNRQAVVVNLFPTRNPDGTPGPNVRVLDVNARTQTNALRLGTRLVAVSVTGTTALIVNEDQDVVRIVDVASSREVAQVPVGSRPSNVVAVSQNTAIVTNGTSGDISFVDIPTRRVTGNPIAVGLDPRSAAVHPGGRYAYVTLGGESAVAVIDLAVNPQRVLAKVGVGRNPVAVSVTPNGQRAAVANLTSNTVSILDISSPASPRLIMNVPTGVQPTAMAINPQNQNLVYVANLGSPYFSVIDMSRDQRSALTGIVQMGTSSAGVQVTSDGARLLIAEFKNQANVRIYDLANMPLEARPAVDIPGEPRLTTFLESTGDCATSFYITEATLASGQREGFWGMEVLVSQGELTGGFNLGGAFQGDGRSPGFGGFLISRAQQVRVNVAAQALPGTTGQVGLLVELLSGSTRAASAQGAPPLTFTADLQPGYYTVRLLSLPGTPSGAFQMGLNAQAFSGGVVVGGYMTSEVTGFGSFCLPRSQNVDMRLLSASEYGTASSGDLVLTIRDGRRTVLRTVNNSIAAPSPVSAPAAPATAGLNIRYYVDAGASPNGTGSSSSPFKSLTAAIEAARSGDVIFVRAGRYSPSRTGEVIPIGSPGPGLVGLQSGVTIVGAGAATTTIDGENTTRSDGNGNALIIPSSNVRFAGFTVRGAAQIGVFAFRADNVIIENNLFTSNTRFGVGAFGTRGLIIRNNVVVSNLESGITVSEATSFATPNAPANCPSSPAGNYGAYIVNNTANDNRADGILISQGGNVCVANNITNNNGSSGIEFNNRVETGTVPALNGTIVNNELSNNGGVQFGFAGTGILVTENATADLIRGNRLQANRPFGIGIFLNGRATLISQNTVTDSSQQGILVQRESTTDEISDNTVRTNGLSGLFVENRATVTRILRNTSTDNGTGMSVLDRSTVSDMRDNTFDRNGVGMEIAGTSVATTVANNTFDANNSGGVFIRESSRLSSFSNNRVRNNRGQGGMLISASTLTISGGTVSNNQATGISLYLGATVTASNATVDSNQAEGGIYVSGGSQLTLSGSTVSNNVRQGILATESGSLATLGGGNAVNNTQLDSTGGGAIGLNAQNGGRITCSGTNTISNNSGGNVFGSVTNCQ